MYRIWRYWRFLLDGRFKVWHLVALGCLWIVMGVAIYAASGYGYSRISDFIAFVFVGNGIAHFFLIAHARQLQAPLEERIERAAERAEAAAAAKEAPIPRAPKPSQPPPPAPLPPAPRLGDDPFRDPPRAAPIVVVRREERSPVPRASSEGAEPAAGPKLLR